MRILHLIPDLSGGGSERQLHYLSVELARMGHEVHAAYLNDGPSRPDYVGVRTHRLRVANNYDPLLLWQLLRLIGRIGPDVVQTWMLQMDIGGGIAAQITQAPWILREPSSAPAYSPSWKTRLRVKIGMRADCIVSNSSGGDRYWSSNVPTSRRFLIRNGIPIDDIARASAQLLTEMDPNLPVVLYVGRLTSDISARKNVRVFLEAIAHIQPEQRVLAILCGDGPQRPELQRLVSNLHLKDSVHFTGYLTGSLVWTLMKRASLFVSLSAYEGCPNAVMEAMACECPLLVSDIPAHRELLDENSALFVEPEDVPGIANSIKFALHQTANSQARASIMGARASEWSIAGMARAYEHVYEEMIRRKRKRGSRAAKQEAFAGDSLMSDRASQAS